jgi:hypothetical protein
MDSVTRAFRQITKPTLQRAMVGWSGGYALDLHSAGAQFESRQGHRLT